MRRKSNFLQMRFFKWVICRVVRRIAYKCDFLRCIYVALKMDAAYMQKDKIAHRREIATIALTSRFQYETYAAYISMSHISADMTFALRTHCFFDGAYVRFLQSDVCAFSFRWQICRIFSMRRMWHWEIIRTYVSSGSSYLRAISVERNTSCIVYNATYASFWINLIYVSFLESHLCRIHYHMRRMFHLLNAINTASALHLLRHAAYVAFVECKLSLIWSLHLLHPGELQVTKTARYLRLQTSRTCYLNLTSASRSRARAEYACP